MPRATGKDHAQVNLDIWGDDDWLDLSPAAQHLYFVLWTSPQLSYCGTGEWHPGRIAARAGGWSAAAVEAAAAELSRRLFLIIDTATDEYLLRSWIKHDGLWRIPNMAVSMANARADVASRTLRSVIVFEVEKLRKREPQLSSWGRDAVVNMLSQAAVDPASLKPFTPRTTLAATDTTTRTATYDLTAPATVSAQVADNPCADPPATPAPSPTSSSILQGGLRKSGTSPGDDEPPDDPPPRFCPAHMPLGPPPGTKCGGCADARRRHDSWMSRQDVARKAQLQAEARAEAQRRAEAAEAAAQAVLDCELCDDDGYRGNRVCDHQQHASDETRAAVMAEVRQLGKPKPEGKQA